MELACQSAEKMRSGTQIMSASVLQATRTVQALVWPFVEKTKSETAIAGANVLKDTCLTSMETVYPHLPAATAQLLRITAS